MRRLISFFRQDSEEDLSLSARPTDSDWRPADFFGKDPEYFEQLLEYLRQRNRAIEAIEREEGTSDDLRAQREIAIDGPGRA